MRRGRHRRRPAYARGMEPLDAARDLVAFAPPGVTVPLPDPHAEPSGFMVAADDGTRVHFLDWGEPDRMRPGPAGGSGTTGGRGAGGAGVGDTTPGVVLVHDIARTAWSWMPVARRLAGIARVVAPDLRGHGLSDAPHEGYDLATLAADAAAVAEGAGSLEPVAVGRDKAGAAGSRVILAGHGFGAAVAAACAADLGERCAGLVLADGGWDDTDRLEGTTIDEWLRSVEEPPEVLASMAAYLADREAWDPGSWDADQERAARAAVVELPAGRVTSSARRHALTACGETLLAYDPAATLARVSAPIVALLARDDTEGFRNLALVRTAAAVARAGRPPLRFARFPAEGHDLVRYRPDEVAAAVLELAAAPTG